MNNHIRARHPETIGLGYHRKHHVCHYYRPRTNYDCEATKYEIFYNKPPRCPEEGKIIDIDNVIIQDFFYIYNEGNKDKLFSYPEKYVDNPILKNLYDDAPVSNKSKSEKSCDDVFYEYLHIFKEKTNEKYFSLLVKFIILFRECYNKSKNDNINGAEKKTFTEHIFPEELPDMCNEFYCEFMESNNFFGLNEDDKKEMIEIILHFCEWLFKNEYTKSKLSLAY